MDKFEAMQELLNWINLNNPKFIVARFDAHEGQKEKEERALVEYVGAATEEEAKEKYTATSELSHGGKFDILVNKNFPDGLEARLVHCNIKFYSNGLRIKSELEVQNNQRPLAEWLMRTKNILPKKWASKP